MKKQFRFLFRSLVMWGTQSTLGLTDLSKPGRVKLPTLPAYVPDWIISDPDVFVEKISKNAGLVHSLPYSQ